MKNEPENKPKFKPKLTWVDPKGNTLYGLADLSKNVRSLDGNIQEHDKHLKKYYKLAIVFCIFIMSVVIFLLWQLKKYKVITLLINALGC